MTENNFKSFLKRLLVNREWTDVRSVIVPKMQKRDVQGNGKYHSGLGTGSKLQMRG